MNTIKNILGNELYDTIIIFMVCLTGAIYLEQIYPPARLPFIFIFYAMWLRFTWRYKERKTPQQIELDKLLELCEKPKDRWGRET